MIFPLLNIQFIISVENFWLFLVARDQYDRISRNVHAQNIILVVYGDIIIKALILTVFFQLLQAGMHSRQ